MAKTAAVPFRFSDYTRAKLEALARDEDRTLSNMMERLINQAYRELQQRRPELPADPILVNGEVVSETRHLGEVD